MNKILIIPDVHGRTFWKEEVYRVIENEENTHIVFLGDYVDPYQYEGIYPEDSIVILEEIIDLKKRCPKQITLLLGNHDCGYIWESVCSARRSTKYYMDINNLFESNESLFDLAYSTEINGQKYLFTHAGVHKIWIDKFINYVGAKINYDMIDFFLNNALHTEAYNDALETFLGQYSYFRSYFGPDYGSCVWADVREMSDELPHRKADKELGYFQIFGHTQLESKPIIQENFACLDVRRYFYLTDENKLLDPTYQGDEYEYDLKK